MAPWMLEACSGKHKAAGRCEMFQTVADNTSRTLNKRERMRHVALSTGSGHGVQTFLLEGRLHRHLQQGRCRSPCQPTSMTHTASQGVRPLTRSGSRPYEEPQPPEHWLRRCPHHDFLRQHTFGCPSSPLVSLTSDPERVLALPRATF